MTKISRRNFGKITLLLSCLTAIGLPGTAIGRPGGMRAFLDKFKNDAFLKRDDIGAAVKSYYQTYNCTTPYPHKFNEVRAKGQMRSLQFYLDHGLEQDYVNHYLTTMGPLLQRIKQLVEKDGGDKGLYSLFEGTSRSYQLMERIDVKPGVRTFPCPYKELLGHCREYLGHVFKMQWEDVCSKWCGPTWNGCADKIGIQIDIRPGEVCTVMLKEASEDEKGGRS